jgi:hypothetical protein
VVFGDGEWVLARHLLHDAGIDAHDRVASLLVVLYAQTVNRISQLTADDVTTADTTVYLHLGVSPMALPSPLVEHVRALLPPRRQTTAGKTAGFSLDSHRGARSTPSRLPIGSEPSASARQLLARWPLPT